ncbi:transglycosylase domain-containing protein [Flavobacterium procerum]|uniref:Transglycosylase domain-containing protein n=1 Tax=Flavobacterium procerum TaxID=1455569 RepID=A0ABV6BXX0_9FLAO
MLKKSLKICFGLLILLTIIITYLVSDFNPIYQNSEFVFITNEIKKSQKESLKPIIEIHNKINEKTKELDCPCKFVSNNIPTITHSSLFKKALYYFKIKKEFSNDECLSFVLLNYDFGDHNRGVEEASKFYFKKNIEQLNKTEILSLIAMLKNSGLYNPFRNGEKLKRKVQYFEKIVQNQSEEK